MPDRGDNQSGAENRLAFNEKLRTGQLERFSLDRFANASAANALSANAYRLSTAPIRRDPHLLQIRSKLTPCNSRNLGADSAQVLGLSARFDRVAHLSFFAAYFTHPGHGITCHNCSAKWEVAGPISMNRVRQYIKPNMTGNAKRFVATACPGYLARRRPNANSSGKTVGSVPVGESIEPCRLSPDFIMGNVARSRAIELCLNMFTCRHCRALRHNDGPGQPHEWQPTRRSGRLLRPNPAVRKNSRAVFSSSWKT